MSLFEVVGRFLEPREGASIEECVRLGKTVPGALVDEDTGVIEGVGHALATVAKLDGLYFQNVPDIVVRATEKAADKEWGRVLPTYQRGAANFISAGISDGVLCNDDIGTGKTVETIAAMSILDPEAVRLVLCPALLRPQWKREIESWAPKFYCPFRPLNVAVLWPPSDRRSQTPIDMSTINWLVAYYLDAPRAVEACRGRPYFLIVDEIHNVRGYRTQRLESVTGATRFAMGRVGLTGSLLYNDAARLHPVLDLISPGAWGYYSRFAERYASGTRNALGFLTTGALSNEVELRERMRWCSFRRAKEDVRSQLPFETKFQTIWLDPSPKLARSAIDAWRSPAAMQAHIKEVAEEKAKLVVEQIRGDIHGGIPSVTFTWLRAQAEQIRDAIVNRAYDYGAYWGKGSPCACVHGEIPATKRLTVIDQHVKTCHSLNVPPTIVGTLGAIGEGINLQWAKVANLAALSFTPDELRQGFGRVARMGQTGTVTIRLFAMRRTIDEHYINVLTRKLKEQFKLDGRRETEKEQLFDALGNSEEDTQKAMKAMYERFLKEEKDELGHLEKSG